MPRYYVRDVYMENILEKKLVNNLLRRSGKNALTTKKKHIRDEIAKMWRQ